MNMLHSHGPDPDFSLEDNGEPAIHGLYPNYFTVAKESMITVFALKHCLLLASKDPQSFKSGLSTICCLGMVACMLLL